MKPKMTRRSFLIKGMYTVAGLFLTPVASYSYARYAEPGWLAVKQVTLTLKRLPAAFDGIRIVQFSDVHLGFHYTVEQLGKLAQRIQSFQPDLICFTGDLFDYSTGQDDGPTAQVLSKLKAPLGKAAVLGNHDYYGKEQKKIMDILSKGGFTVLMNDSIPIQRGTSRLWLSGVDDMLEGKADLAAALKKTAAQEECVILLSHCPDFADTTLKYPVDLQLSGHSHGGQVRLPFYGHLYAPDCGQKYVDGLYTLGDGKLQVYTNRGIGVSVYPIRFWCRPELTVLTLRKGNGG